MKTQSTVAVLLACLLSGALAAPSPVGTQPPPRRAESYDKKTGLLPAGGGRYIQGENSVKGGSPGTLGNPYAADANIGPSQRSAADTFGGAKFGPAGEASHGVSAIGSAAGASMGSTGTSATGLYNVETVNQLQQNRALGKVSDRFNTGCSALTLYRPLMLLIKEWRAEQSTRAKKLGTRARVTLPATEVSKEAGKHKSARGLVVGIHFIS